MSAESFSVGGPTLFFSDRTTKFGLQRRKGEIKIKDAWELRIGGVVTSPYNVFPEGYEMKEQYKSHTDIPDSWQAKIQLKMQQFLKVPIPFPFPWLLIAGVLFGIGYIIIRTWEQNSLATRLLAMKTVLIAAAANSVVFFEKLLDELADSLPELVEEEKKKASDWINEKYDYIFWSKKNIVVGFLVGCVVPIASVNMIHALFQSVPGRIFAYFTSFTIGFMAGSTLWAMWGIAKLMSSLGKDMKIRPSIFDSETCALRTASSILWKVSLTAAALYTLGISQIVVCPVELGIFSNILIVIFAAFVVLYFIIPQMNIHRTLLQLKRGRLKVLVNQIDNTFDIVAKNPTAENINQLRELFDLQHVVNGKSSWSFGTPELLALMGTVIIPLIIFILRSYLKGDLHL